MGSDLSRVSILFRSISPTNDTKIILTAAEFSRIYKLTKNENNNEVLYLLSLIENGYCVVIQLDCLLFVLLGRYATDGFFRLARANKQ